MYLYNVFPALLIEDILSEVFFVDLLGLGNHLHGNHWSRQPSFQYILQAKEHGLWELSSPRLKVGTHMGGSWWVLLGMCNLKYNVQNDDKIYR